MQPYRLEMGTKLQTNKGKNLYEFWDNKITDKLNQNFIECKNEYLINLASNEYFDSVNQSASRVFNKLANSGILVRQMDVYGIKNSLRVTIGNSKENKKFISVLRRIFNV